MVTKRKYYKLLFIIGAIWNFILALSYLAQTFIGPVEFSGRALMYYQGFLISVLLFGVGYLIVGLDIKKNHGIVWLGAVGKVLVFGSFLANYLMGHLPLYLVLIGTGDLIFALLFFEFLFWSKKAPGQPQ